LAENASHKITSNKKAPTCVDRRDARVISRFPLRPRRAGTRIKTSETSTNTFQCCNTRNVLNNAFNYGTKMQKTNNYNVLKGA
jgi:hypothetical protein